MSTDRIGRRSRFTRTPTGKRIFLTERDYRILDLLYRYRYLRATQILAFLQPQSPKRLIERLGDLYHERGLVDRPKAQWRDCNARYKPIVYELSGKGLKLMGEQGPLPKRAMTLSRRQRTGVSTQFEHAMMIVDGLVEIELECITAIDERFVCVDEILDNAPDETRAASNPLAIPITLQPSKRFPELKTPWDTLVIPDALYGIEKLIDGEEHYRFWALECERNSPKRRKKLDLSSTAKKRALYRELNRHRLPEKHWGIPDCELNLVTEPSKNPA